MYTIDSFINVPLDIIAAVSIVLFIFLLIIKLRKKAKISLAFFLVTAIVGIGSIYCSISGYYTYLAFTIILAELVLLPYLIVKAFVNPQKIEEKKAAKKAAESSASRESNFAMSRKAGVRTPIMRSGASVGTSLL